MSYCIILLLKTLLGRVKMKLLRAGVVFVFFATLCVFIFTFISERFTEDTTIPTITIKDKILEVEVGATEEDFLKGVTAFDEKDKDLTADVIVESVSKFIDDGVCKVTYAVCDSDNHVAKATRKIHYKGYEHPKFKLNRSICYSIYENVNVLDDIKAIDTIDGDISKNIIITSENFTGSVAGVYTMNASVSNSNGDVYALNLPLIFEDRSVAAPEIELKDYLIYTKPGQKVDFEKLISSVTDSEGDSLRDEVSIEGDINPDKEGVYTVHYYAEDDSGRRGHTVLVVVVEN